MGYVRSAFTVAGWAVSRSGAGISGAIRTSMGSAGLGRVVVARAGMAGECGLHGAKPRVRGAVLEVGGELREVGACQQQRFGAAGVRAAVMNEPIRAVCSRHGAAQDPRYVRDVAHQPVVLCGMPRDIQDLLRAFPAVVMAWAFSWPTRLSSSLMVAL